jgi:hypothetical protein
MKRFGALLKSIFLFVTMLALLLSLTLATYAWFSTNREVSTDTAATPWRWRSAPRAATTPSPRLRPLFGR